MKTWDGACRGLGLSPMTMAPLTTLEAAKYWLRACLQGDAHARWMHFLRSQQSLRAMVAARPHLLWKLQRDYLQAGLPLRLKLAWLMQHHGWALQALPAAALHALHTDAGFMLAELPLPEGLLQLDLGSSERFAKEGEWVLRLQLAGHQIAALAFTVHHDPTEPCVHIGCLQGSDRAGQRDAVRDATKALHGLRPKQAVMTALYALMGALGVGQVQAVGNTSHVYQAKWRRRDRIAADYDGFWTELGGHPGAGGGWRLPARLARKALADVPSKHRAQLRRRQALEDLLVAQIGERLALPLTTTQVFAAAA